MYCPSCNGNMQISQISCGDELLEITICENCEGIFYDFEELTLHLEGHERTTSLGTEIIRGDAIQDHSGKTYVCPKCAGQMTERNYLYDSGIHLDICQDCHGIFLEKGEFDAIERYVDSLTESKEGKKMNNFAEHLGEKIEKAQENILYKKSQWDTELEKNTILGTNPVNRLELITEFIMHMHT